MVLCLRKCKVPEECINPQHMSSSFDIREMSSSSRIWVEKIVFRKSIAMQKIFQLIAISIFKENTYTVKIFTYLKSGNK